MRLEFSDPSSLGRSREAEGVLASLKLAKCDYDRSIAVSHSSQYTRILGKMSS